MKKFLTFTLCIAMVSTLLTGCGNGNAEVVDSNTVTEEVQTVEPETEVEPTEEVKEDSDAEKDTPEEKAEEKTFADTGLTEEYALEKFARAVSAYSTLRDNREKAFEANATCHVFTDQIFLTEAETKDGFSLNIDTDDYDTLHKVSVSYYAMFTKYFDEYVNNNGEYYDFAEYYKEHNIDEFLDYYNMDVFSSGDWDTSQVYMMNMIYMESFTGEISLKNITDDVSVEYKTISMPYNKTVDVAWQCDIYMNDEDTGLKLLFDKDGNLLNINDENCKIEKIVPFKTN